MTNAKSAALLSSLVLGLSLCSCSGDSDPSTPYVQGDMAGHDAVYVQMSESVSSTTGALLQAILAVNSFLYTDSTVTDLQTFNLRKADADKALDVLIRYATKTESILATVMSESGGIDASPAVDGGAIVDASAAIDAYRTEMYRSFSGLPTGPALSEETPPTVSAAEVLVTVSSGPSNKQLRTLMATYQVNAQTAKQMLDNAMSELSTTYNNQAAFADKAMRTATLIKEGAGLTLTVCGAVVTAGGATGALGVADAAVTLITGVDGVVKTGKAGLELVTGKDQSLPGGTVGTVLTGVSDVSELIGLATLRKWTDPSDKVANVYTIAIKTSDALFDKQLNLGAHSFDLTQLTEAILSQVKGTNDVPTALPGSYIIQGTKVQIGALPESVTNVTNRLPDTDKLAVVAAASNAPIESPPEMAVRDGSADAIVSGSLGPECQILAACCPNLPASIVSQCNEYVDKGNESNCRTAQVSLLRLCQ